MKAQHMCRLVRTGVSGRLGLQEMVCMIHPRLPGKRVFWGRMRVGPCSLGPQALLLPLGVLRWPCLPFGHSGRGGGGVAQGLGGWLC